MAISFGNDEIEVIKKLWRDGRSARQIAIEVGRSRNSVIGKIHRLGIQRGGKPLKAKAQTLPKRPVGVPKNLNLKQKLEPPMEPAEVAILPEWIPGTGVRLLDLRNGVCKFPLNEVAKGGEFFFCGEKALKDCPYCGAHARLSYQPLSSLNSRRAA